MHFALSPQLDVATARIEYAQRRYVRLDPFLDEACAAALCDRLLAQNGWSHTFNSGAKSFEIAREDMLAMPADQKAKLTAAISEAAAQDFQYRFDSIRVADDEDGRRKRGWMLDEYAMFLNSREVLDVFEDITSMRDADLVDAQATIYREGDFLTAHDDAVEGKGRLAAHVLGLTRIWRDEWGGLLMFHGSDGCGSFSSPRFNVLDLFDVPQTHSVSQVTASAQYPRLSITGWIRNTR